MAKTSIALTDKQIKALEPLMKKTARAGKANKPGMLLAQIISFNDGKVIALCGFVGHDTAKEIQKAMNPFSVGSTTDETDFTDARIDAGLPV